LFGYRFSVISDELIKTSKQSTNLLMRKLYFLVPGTRGKFGGGGLWAELNTVHLAQEICEAEVVTYRVSEKQHPFLADILPTCDPKSAIFVIGWGFDVPKIINQFYLFT